MAKIAIESKTAHTCRLCGYSDGSMVNYAPGEGIDLLHPECAARHFQERCRDLDGQIIDYCRIVASEHLPQRLSEIMACIREAQDLLYRVPGAAPARNQLSHAVRLLRRIQ
jgi:hypothetical protein